jgi:hypothetical protein
MTKFLGFLAGGIAALLLAGFVLADPAWGEDSFVYKNPKNPTKNAKALKDSQYRGFHYERKFEGYRKCIMARESGGNYKSDGRWGSGAYQFVQSTWDSAMKQANKPEWIGVRPNKAPPYVQDEAFWIKANPYPKRKGLHGRSHWSSAHAAKFGFKTFDC